jgi:2Fe-2S ferredoxin
MARVTFLPSGTAAAAAANESLFEIGRRSGVPISTSCNGKASCGLCRVTIVAGEEHLTPLGPLERRHLGNVYFITKQRLSCQTRLTDDAAEVTVDVPA